jgi:UMF1 family MFS transporter
MSAGAGFLYVFYVLTILMEGCMGTVKRASRKEIFGWAMFDFANSSYTTVIVTVVFSVIFPRLIVGDGPEYRMGNLFWSLSLAISYFIILLTAPVLGAITDYRAAKKKFLFYSCVVTSIFTAYLYFIQPGMIWQCMFFLIISNIGFSYSEAFVSSFLPSLGPPEDLGKISGYAWGLGYFGGLASTAIVIFGLGPTTAENFANLRFVGPITGAFFILAAIPTFLWVREPTSALKEQMTENPIIIGFKRLKNTLQSAKDFKDLLILLFSFIFAYAGLSIVIAFAFIYGDQVIKWDHGTQVIMFIVTQITAAGGAFLFGIIQDRIGARVTYNITLVLWVVSITLIYGASNVTAFINNIFSSDLQTQTVFLFIGSTAGLGLGATQSACRAMVGLFSPQSKAGEFYGLWSMTSRLAAIIGLLGLGLLQAAFGLRIAILLCSAFFLISIIITMFINEERGRASASMHEGE